MGLCVSDNLFLTRLPEINQFNDIGDVFIVGEDKSEEGEEIEDDSDSYDRRTEEMKYQSDTIPPLPAFFTPPVRSFACDKHSKWKKKCPTNCPLRREQARILVRWADDLVPADGETDVVWEDIAKTLNRSVNSTKKKFMRLTNQWSPSSATTSTRAYRSTNKYKRKRGVDTTWEEDECDTDVEGDSTPHCEFREERRATIVCEKHRRWKKRCPIDCKDKREEVKGTINITSEKKIYRHRSAGVVGRPAVSCRRHQIEHQKCPADCPRRRTVDQYRHDREQRRDDPASPSRCASSSTESQVSSSANFISPPSPLPVAYNSKAHTPTVAPPQNISPPTSFTSQISTETSTSAPFYHEFMWESPATFRREGLEQDFHWYRPRDNTTVSNLGIILDLIDCGLPCVSNISQSCFSESEIETNKPLCYSAHTSVSVPDPVFSPTPPSPIPSSPLPSPPSLTSSILPSPTKNYTTIMQLLIYQHKYLHFSS